MVSTGLCLRPGSGSIPLWAVAERHVHLFKDTMNATEAIKEIYTLEDLKEIADHGCQSAVCSQHIYYGHTVQFYDTFETDILDELTLNYGTDFLVDMFRDADADLTHYKNAVCWAFIELVAMEAVQDYNHEYAQANLTMEPVWV